MIRCDTGDVVLVRFPFTDLTATKKRPALILSPKSYTTQSGDIVVLAMTSKRQPDSNLEIQNWQAAGLAKPTWIKPLIGTIGAKLVERRLGKLHTDDRVRATYTLKLLLAPEWM